MTSDGRSEPLTDERRLHILHANQQFALQALRVLGIAMRPLEQAPPTYVAMALERDLIFLGLMAMKDPIRPEAIRAVAACRAAGIRTVMITGDHKDTAVAIERELGLMEAGAQAISGTELNELSDAQLLDRVERITIYARVAAEHKLRVVRAWKKRGAVVAMTGDGVNDAPAVKAADIGIAMGITGTDVTKEASDMVITDDNFASIAAAVEEGRAIFDNIRKAIRYLLSCNISEILLMLLAALFGLPLPLLPVQILWINLVTDGLPALALAVDPPDEGLMRQPPRPPSERLLSAAAMLNLFVQGAFIAVITLLAFLYCVYGMDLNLDRARTLTFTIMVLAQLFHALNNRSDRRSLFELGIWTNKPLLGTVAISALLQVAIVLSPSLHEIFKITTFNPEHWLLALGIGILPLVAMEIWKLYERRVMAGHER